MFDNVYFGLNDRHGKKLRTGDRVKVYFFDDDLQAENFEIFTIAYNTELFAFCLRGKREDLFFTEGSFLPEELEFLE